MTEETMIENQPEKTPSKGARIKAVIKEWFRKRIVMLKVKPQLIPLVLMVITTVYFMLILFRISIAVDEAKEASSATGICTFITTLLSLLYLVSFLNVFPKRKKPNIFFMVIVGAMIAGQIACDLI